MRVKEGHVPMNAQSHVRVCGHHSKQQLHRVLAIPVSKSCGDITNRLVAIPNYACPRYNGKTLAIDGRTKTADVDVDGTVLGMGPLSVSFCLVICCARVGAVTVPLPPGCASIKGC